MIVSFYGKNSEICLVQDAKNLNNTLAVATILFIQTYTGENLITMLAKSKIYIEKLSYRWGGYQN